MRLSRLAVLVVLGVTCLLRAEGRQQSEPKAPQSKPKAESGKSESAPAPVQAPAKVDTKNNANVDAAGVTGSTFESRYFNFTYELPKGWKALDDSARVASNREVLQEDAERAKVLVSTPKKTSAKSNAPKPQPADSQTPLLPERYSLMAAAPNGLDSLASPVLPRINIWAHRRIPPMDKAMDHAQLLMAGKHATPLVRPQEVNFDGHSFARAEIITSNGEYQSRYITVIGDYLVGFDFWSTSEREMVEISDTIKTVKFK
jgi:hypothetical protein